MLGLARIALIVWFFWLVKAKGVRAARPGVGLVLGDGAAAGVDKSARLPEGQTVLIEFLRREPGEYEFACQMGMFRGKLIME